MPIHIRPISISNYRQFIDSKTIVTKRYATDPEWLSIYGDKLEINGIFDDGDNLVGYFFLFFGKKINQPYCITPPYTNTIHLHFSNQATNKASYQSVLKNLHSAIASYLIERKLILINIVFPPSYFDAQPYLWNDFEASLKYTYVLDLSQPIDTILSNYSSERRKNITKAKKDGITSQIVYNFPLLYEMTYKTLTSKNADSDAELVKNIFFDYANEKNAFGCISYYNNQPSAMVFCLVDESSAYYLFGYSDKDNGHEGAHALAIHTAIEHCKNSGLSAFDFCGSMIPAIERYFRGFGAELQPMMQILKASNKGKLLLRLRNRKISK
jgi:hypothetical protein